MCMETFMLEGWKTKQGRQISYLATYPQSQEECLCVCRFLCPPVLFSLYRFCGYSLPQDCVCELGKKLDSLRECIE